MRMIDKITIKVPTVSSDGAGGTTKTGTTDTSIRGIVNVKTGSRKLENGKEIGPVYYEITVWDNDYSFNNVGDYSLVWVNNGSKVLKPVAIYRQDNNRVNTIIATL